METVTILIATAIAGALLLAPLIRSLSKSQPDKKECGSGCTACPIRISPDQDCMGGKQ